ncbi:hypothetical protein BDV12DRAFT_178227 [Aspergillus spectabilis]
MKSTILLPLLPAVSAWTCTWRNADGESTTEEGRGPSECIVIDHAQGQLFELDGENEPNINMLLFTNDECAGDPAGQATESFAKEASVDLLGFQVVEYGSSGNTTTSGTATATETGTATDDEGTLTLPTVTDDEGTFTLPTVSQTNGTTTATPTSTTETEAETDSTETPDVTETSTSTVTEPTSTDSPPTATDSEEPEATPTDAASNLVLSRTGLVGVAMGLVAGVWALDLLF